MMNTKIIDDSFGLYFRDLRASCGLTLRDYCLKTGRDVGNHSKMERGLIPPPSSVTALKKILGPLTYSTKDFMDLRLIACLYWQRHYEEKVKSDFGNLEPEEEKQTWKIIQVSNFDKEEIDDKLICENIKDHQHGLNMLAGLLVGVHDSSMYYYRLVPSDYTLHEYDPNY